MPESQPPVTETMRSSYTLPADVYDAFNARVPFGHRSKIIEQLIRKYLANEVSVEIPPQSF